MTFDLTCPNGHVFQSLFASVMNMSTPGAMTGNQEGCPHCGALCTSPDVFAEGDQVWVRLKGPGVDRGTLIQLQRLASSVRSGQIAPALAVDQMAKQNAGLAELLAYAGANANILGLIISIVGALIALYAVYDSDQSSAAAHQDALSIKQAIEDNTEAVRNNAQASRSADAAPVTAADIQVRIDAEVAELNVLLSQAKAAEQRSTQGPATKNRHERRKERRLRGRGQ